MVTPLLQLTQLDLEALWREWPSDFSATSPPRSQAALRDAGVVCVMMGVGGRENSGRSGPFRVQEMQQGAGPGRWGWNPNSAPECLVPHCNQSPPVPSVPSWPQGSLGGHRGQGCAERSPTSRPHGVSSEDTGPTQVSSLLWALVSSP